MIFGQWSLAEFDDLIRDKDYDVAQVQAAHDKVAAAWRARDPATVNAWESDWSALLKRYADARTDARVTAARVLPGPDDMKPVDGSYKRVLAALRRTEGVESPGDFIALVRRLNDVVKGIDFSAQPQLRSRDFDLGAIKGADAVLKPVEAGVTAVTTGAKSATPWIVGGIATVTLGALLLRR